MPYLITGFGVKQLPAGLNFHHPLLIQRHNLFRREAFAGILFLLYQRPQRIQLLYHLPVGFLAGLLGVFPDHKSNGPCNHQGGCQPHQHFAVRFCLF
ncbi:hypothetical protein D9M69_584000 [compost metagenome]